MCLMELNITRTFQVWSQWKGFSQAVLALSRRNPSCHRGNTRMSDTNSIYTQTWVISAQCVSFPRSSTPGFVFFNF